MTMPSLRTALPFWLSLALIPPVLLAATYGGWALLLPPIAGWFAFSLFDAIAGLSTENADPMTPEGELFWYRLITLIWVPIEVILLFGLIWYQGQATHLSGGEKLGLFFGMGILSGTVGINYAHELLHQRNRLERWLGDILLALVLYSHFRSEHLLVHHRYVGTPRDPVTARYNEGFHRYFPRVLWQQVISAWRAEGAMQAREGLRARHRRNPMYRYTAASLAFLLLAYLIGGWVGIGLFLVQAFVAVLHLEMTNYIEHYGLTRRHLGGGKYEHVKPHHSWNANHRVSNWFLINLQRHSDHHYKPDRRFPLLQAREESEAPQLPFGYPVMTILAACPPLFRRVMNPRVRAWRQQFYPDITDWSAYKATANPVLS